MNSLHPEMPYTKELCIEFHPHEHLYVEAAKFTMLKIFFKACIVHKRIFTNIEQNCVHTLKLNVNHLIYVRVKLSYTYMHSIPSSGHLPSNINA